MNEKLSVKVTSPNEWKTFGKGDVSKWVKNSRVGRTPQTNIKIVVLLLFLWLLGFFSFFFLECPFSIIIKTKMLWCDYSPMFTTYLPTPEMFREAGMSAPLSLRTQSTDIWYFPSPSLALMVPEIMTSEYRVFTSRPTVPGLLQHESPRITTKTQITWPKECWTIFL